MEGTERVALQHFSWDKLEMRGKVNIGRPMSASHALAGPHVWQSLPHIQLRA